MLPVASQGPAPSRLRLGWTHCCGAPHCPLEHAVQLYWTYGPPALGPVTHTLPWSIALDWPERMVMGLQGRQDRGRRSGCWEHW